MSQHFRQAIENQIRHRNELAAALESQRTLAHRYAFLRPSFSTVGLLFSLFSLLGFLTRQPHAQELTTEKILEVALRQLKQSDKVVISAPRPLEPPIVKEKPLPPPIAPNTYAEASQSELKKLQDIAAQFSQPRTVPHPLEQYRPAAKPKAAQITAPAFAPVVKGEYVLVNSVRKAWIEDSAEYPDLIPSKK